MRHATVNLFSIKLMQYGKVRAFGYGTGIYLKHISFGINLITEAPHIKQSLFVRNTL
jgi:hypothetical protein